MHELRVRAEHALSVTRDDVQALSRHDVKSLVYELQVHQVELEMQAESLRAAELELSQSLAQYQELFACAPVGYVTLNAQGRVTRANEAAKAWLAESGSRLLGRALDELLSPHARAAYRQLLHSMPVGAHAQLEVEAADRAGGPLYLQLDVTCSQAPERGWLVALSDVTQRKRNVDELEQRVSERTAELTAKNLQLEAEFERRTKSEAMRRSLETRLRESERFESLGLLAGGIAHDFNNLLVGVMGNAELVDMTPELPETCREPLSLIVRACRQSLELTRQLLVCAGKGGQLNLAAVNLPKLVAENMELLRARVPPGVQLQVKVGRDIPPIRADRAQVSQLLMNVLTNALEALSGAGVVVVETWEEVLSAKALADFDCAHTAHSGRFVMLSLRDSGTGMDEQTRARIFDPFFSTKFPGRGLGLATVRGIVKSHRGAMRVISSPGNGTCFEIALPAVESRKDAAPSRSDAASQWHGSGPILLVDDEDSVRRVFGKLLGALGFDVTEAMSGNQALELFSSAERAFELVVLDWIMPGMTGKQTLEALRKLAPELPVILISGYNPEDIGTYDRHVICLQKPMTFGELRAAAYRLLVEQAAERARLAH